MCVFSCCMSSFSVFCWLVGTQIGTAISRVPDNIKLHDGIARVMAAKAEMIKSGKGIDWGTAEALAFGSLALEGNWCVLWHLVVVVVGF